VGARTILVAAEPFGGTLSAAAVGAAIGRGLRAGDAALEPDLYALEGLDGPGGRGLGDDWDARMRGARAVVLAAARLDGGTLRARGPVFEAATRARQAGVPCYAVAGRNGLDGFEARMMDLQVVLEAGDARALRAAGRRLADVV
jgi:glycerate kinase